MTDYRERLRSFLDLKEGWDGYKADPIAQCAVEGMERLLDEVGGMPPECNVFPAAWGGVYLERNDGTEWSVTSEPDGRWIIWDRSDGEVDMRNGTYEEALGYVRKHMTETRG